MAKGDVVLKFDGQTAEFVQKMLQMRQEMLKTGETAKTMAQHTSESGNVMKEAFHGVVEEVGLITSIAGAAAGGVKLIMETTEDYFERLHKKAEALREEIQTLSGALASAGNLGKFKEVEDRLAGMAAQKSGNMEFSKEELFKVYATLQGRFRTKSPEELYSAVEEYQRARSGSLQPEDATDVATQYARLSDSGNQQYAMAAHVAGLAPEDMRGFNRAKDKKGYLDLVLASKRPDVEEGPRMLQTVEALAAQRHVDISEVLAHPEWAPEFKMQEGIKNLARGAAEYAKRPLPTLEDQIAATGSNPLLRQQTYAEATKARAQQRKETPEGYVRMVNEDVEERIFGDLRKNSKYAPDWWLKMQAAGGPFEGSGKPMRGVSQETIDQYESAWNLKFPGHYPGHDDLLPVLNGMREDQERQHREALEQQEKLKSNPQLKNDNPGQK